MKVALSVPGKFHSFDLARQLQARNSLAAIFTGYPRFKLRHEGLPQHLIRTWPWLQTPYMAWPQRHLLGTRALRAWEWLAKTQLDAHVARRLPECDVFVGLSGSALESGKVARQRGAHYVCDRGSAHVRVQDNLLRDEAERWGIPFEGIDPRVIEREEAEYAEADCIAVPSSFSRDSFVKQGVPPHKLHLLPYGVDLSRFQPSGQPAPERFDALYVGGMNLNKGIPYLLQAYQAFRHPRKSLTLAGESSPAFMAAMRKHGLWSDDIKVLGHVPQIALKELMSRSHVMVLPSVQDGFGMVLSQAMACGCVVIGSRHTGAPDLLDDGKEGFIVPARDADSITARLQWLADQPHRRLEISKLALRRVENAGGWQDYGDQAMRIFQSLREA